MGTDLLARGLDIPEVDMVVNFDLPIDAKEYVHRVGRTARAGKAGRAITLIGQYNIESYLRLEHLLGYKLPLFETQEESVLVLLERVQDAQRMTTQSMSERSKESKTVRNQGSNQGGCTSKKRKWHG